MSARSPSREPQEADLRSLENYDGMAGIRNALRQIADERADWAGIPLPLDDQNLVIEPTYPNAEALSKIGGSLVQTPEDYYSIDGKTVRNIFWSSKLKSRVVVYEDGGRVCHGVDPGVHHFKYDLQTLGASDAWGIEQEHNALQLLATMIGHRQFKQYLLTGMFMESSKRSGLTYVFRKLRPTVVLDARGKSVRIRCCLCMHPIGYYADSWAGAMTPTDDVVAHLSLMRSDEPMLWRRANQHEPHKPEAGL